MGFFSIFKESAGDGGKGEKLTKKTKKGRTTVTEVVYRSGPGGKEFRNEQALNDYLRRNGGRS